MKLTCPECNTSYAASPNALGEGGRKVKCHKCAHVWFATPEDAFATVEPAEVDIAATEQDDTADIEQDDTAGTDTDTPSEFDDVEFEEEAGDGMTSDPDGLQSSDDAEAEATWERVLEDVGLAAPDDDSHDSDAFDAGGDEPGADGDDDHLDIETLAARRLGNMPGAKEPAGARKDARKAGRRRVSLPSISGPILLVASIVLAIGLAGAAAFVMREQIVSRLPGSARLYAAIGYPVNLRGLDLVNVNVTRGVEKGMPVLAVTGEIVNISDATRPVPEIRFSLRNELSQEIYHWTGRAEAGELGPAGRARFLTRLAAPPAAARELQVRFTGQAHASDGSRS